MSSFKYVSLDVIGFCQWTSTILLMTTVHLYSCFRFWKVFFSSKLPTACLPYLILVIALSLTYPWSHIFILCPFSPFKCNFVSILIRANKMQQYAGIYLLQNYSTCFGCISHPSSGVYKTVTAAPGTGHITYQKLQLQFDVFLMMGATDSRNM